MAQMANVILMTTRVSQYRKNINIKCFDLMVYICQCKIDNEWPVVRSYLLCYWSGFASVLYYRY